ncbi:MAG TPA: hypothetical protein VLC09_20650 [Polyangiaceae bacterium]|nr:hypothetical protein [Polyangiaceae bacterium]
MDGLAVCAWSAITPLGHDVREAALAYRAGVSGLRECAILDSTGEAPTIGSVPVLAPHLEGTERLLALAEHALAAIVERLRDAAGRGRIKLFVLLDEDLAATETGGRAPAEVVAANLQHLVEQQAGARIPVEFGANGSAGLGAVLERAAEELEQRHYEFALVLATHTDWGLGRIALLSAQERIYSSENLDRILLGEAGAGLLLCSRRFAHSLGQSPPVWLERPAVTQEKARFDNDHSAFEALAMTVAARRASDETAGRGERIGWVSSDSSFEIFRTYELQSVLVRLQSRLAPPQVLEQPCQRMGFLGAASGAWQVAYAAELTHRGAAPAPSKLCLLGSEDGTRTAFMLHAGA